MSRDGVACQERARGSRITGPTHQEARRQHPLAGGRSCTAVAARQNGPDDLAAELNPHKPELTPIEQSRQLAVRADQRRFRARASPIARQPVNAESAITPPAIRSARDALRAPLAELAHAYPPRYAWHLNMRDPSEVRAELDDLH